MLLKIDTNPNDPNLLTSLYQILDQTLLVVVEVNQVVVEVIDLMKLLSVVQ